MASAPDCRFETLVRRPGHASDIQLERLNRLKILEIIHVLVDLVEFPGACFRRLVTARNKTFEELLEEQGKNRLAGLLILGIFASPFVYILVLN